ncbi:MAG TPA: hypothetical protein DCP92_15405 [Nitrospiraceae bacterium]|nr:hypothetical protein [Nitrospiraceae bacterium]
MFTSREMTVGRRDTASSHLERPPPPPWDPPPPPPWYPPPPPLRLTPPLVAPLAGIWPAVERLWNPRSLAARSNRLLSERSKALERVAARGLDTP